VLLVALQRAFAFSLARAAIVVHDRSMTMRMKVPACPRRPRNRSGIATQILGTDDSSDESAVTRERKLRAVAILAIRPIRHDTFY